MTDIQKQNKIPCCIAVVVILLMMIGTVFVFSASANVTREISLERFYESASLRQIVFFPVAILIMYVVSCIDYQRFSAEKGWAKSVISYALFASIILLIVVLIPGIGVEKNFARRWLAIPFGPVAISFQPSEFAKWSVIFFLAAFCDKYRDSMNVYWKRFVLVCGIVALPVGLIIIEDFGTAALVALFSFLMLLIGGVKFWHILTPLPFGAVAFIAAIINSPTRLKRIYAFLEPEKWADSTAYQAQQSLIALGSGGIWGKGLGRGICKYGHLPEDTTDFIFAIIGEELGFFGTFTVILLFIIFIWLGILVVVRCRDRFGQLLAGGIVLAIAIQAALNIGVVTVVLPTKGMPLPFVSAGGTSLLLSVAAVGVLINIAKKSPKESLKKGVL